MIVRDIEATDVPNLTDLTLQSFDHYDVMYKMGREYLNDVFFQTIIEADSASGFVAANEDQILGYAMYFNDLEAFYKVVRNGRLFKNVALIATKTVTGVFSINDLLNLAFGHRKVFSLVNRMPHFGPVALAKTVKGTPVGGYVVLSLWRAILSRLKDQCAKQCWGIADSRNETSWKLMEALKFRRECEINLFGRKDYLYVLSLDGE